MRHIGNRLHTLLAAAMLALPASVSAHPALVRSSPAKDATLVVSPRVIHLTFSEGVVAALSTVTITGPTGVTIAFGKLAQVPDSVKTLVLPINGTVPNGRYLVKWRAGGKDGHAIRGEYSFTVAVPAPAPEPAMAAPAETVTFSAESPLYVAARVLRYAGLLSLVGTFAFVLAVLPRVRMRDGAHAKLLHDEALIRIRTIAGWSAAVLLLTCIVRLPLQVASMTDMASVRDAAIYRTVIFSTTWGQAWLLEFGAVVLVMGSLLRIRGKTGWVRTALLAPPLALAASLSGHAVSVEGRSVAAVLVDALHVLSASGWAGGVLLLVVAGIPAALSLDVEMARIATQDLVQAFSPVALVCAALLVASGGVTAWLHLGSLPALWQSVYGRVLLVKLGLLVGMATIGAWNWRGIAPAIGLPNGPRRIQRSAAFETVFAAAIVVMTAVLVATPTPIDSVQ